MCKLTILLYPSRIQEDNRRECWSPGAGFLCYSCSLFCQSAYISSETQWQMMSIWVRTVETLLSLSVFDTETREAWCFSSAYGNAVEECDWLTDCCNTQRGAAESHSLWHGLSFTWHLTIAGGGEGGQTHTHLIIIELYLSSPGAQLFMDLPVRKRGWREGRGGREGQREGGRDFSEGGRQKKPKRHTSLPPNTTIFFKERQSEKIQFQPMRLVAEAGTKETRYSNLEVTDTVSAIITTLPLILL